MVEAIGDIGGAVTRANDGLRRQVAGAVGVAFGEPARHPRPSAEAAPGADRTLVFGDDPGRTGTAVVSIFAKTVQENNRQFILVVADAATAPGGGASRQMNFAARTVNRIGVCQAQG